MNHRYELIYLDIGNEGTEDHLDVSSPFELADPEEGWL